MAVRVDVAAWLYAWASERSGLDSEAGFLAWDAYRRADGTEFRRVMELIGAGGGGGDFYNTQPARVSKRFARSVIVSTLQGQTLYADAFKMLGLKKLATFNGMGERLGVM